MMVVFKRTSNKVRCVKIKSFPNPPKAVVMVMEAIMILLQEKTDWKSIRDQITDTNGFIERLRSFNVMSAPESLFGKVRNAYLSKPEFDIADIKKKSMAASFMAMWVKAVNRYQEVTKIVVPKQKKYNEVKAVLD